MALTAAVRLDSERVMGRVACTPVHVSSYLSIDQLQEGGFPGHVWPGTASYPDQKAGDVNDLIKTRALLHLSFVFIVELYPL